MKEKEVKIVKSNIAMNILIPKTAKDIMLNKNACWRVAVSNKK